MTTTITMGHDMATIYATCTGCDRVLAECDHTGELCAACQARHDRFMWIEDTEAAVRRLCELHGWRIEPSTSIAERSSRYYAIDRGHNYTAQHVVLRIGEHADVHRAADASLAMVPGDHDTTIDALAVLLARPFEAG